MPGYAFPNAYVSTDEPPRRSWTRSGLLLFTIAGVGYFGAVILVLSLVATPYSPISQFASDYGVGAYALEMNSGFFLAGGGVLSLAIAIFASGASRVTKSGAALLLPAGVALLLSGFFQTDLEGAVSTFHGAVHNFAGVVFFISSPVGLTLVSKGIGLRRFAIAVAAFVAGLAFAVANSAMGLNATGLAERVVILFVFSSLILTAAELLRES